MFNYNFQYDTIFSQGLGNGSLIYKCRKGCKGTFPYCVPACDNCPPNSNCTEPNFCTCYSGYKTIQKDRKLVGCQSICESGCPPHSSCGIRGKCECDMNYEEDKSNSHSDKNMMVCSPIDIPDTIPDTTPVCINPCPPNSDCVAVNKCECKKGFKEEGFLGGHLKCQKESSKTLSNIDIIIYSLIICALLLVILAAICMVMILVKMKNEAKKCGDCQIQNDPFSCEFTERYL